MVAENIGLRESAIIGFSKRIIPNLVIDILFLVSDRYLESFSQHLSLGKNLSLVDNACSLRIFHGLSLIKL